MKSLFQAFPLVGSVVLLSGCAGLLIDSMAKSSVTGDTYAEMKATLKPLDADEGRLFIYRTEESTKSSFRYGIGIQKNPTVCTVDNMAYEIVWEAFKFFDLPEGRHDVTCGNDVVAKTDFWSGKRHYQKGANAVQVYISGSTEYFVRVVADEDAAAFRPEIVNPKLGRDEIENLPYEMDEKFHTFPAGKVSASAK